MLKQLVIATAVSGLMTTTALAQTPTTPAPGAQPSETRAASPATANFITAQTADQWLSSKFIGTDVVGTDNAKIGDVSDVLFDKNGMILGYIVGVGGFLGIGSKDVALAPASFETVPASDSSSSPKLKLAMTKDQLQQAPDFKRYEPPRATVGSGGGGMGPGASK